MKNSFFTKLLAIIVISSFLSVETGSAATPDNSDSIAIIIGNRNYVDARKVEFAIRDAKAIKAFLIQKLGYDENNIVYIEDATLGRMRAWFGGNIRSSKLWKKVMPGRSNVFVFYSGHGAPAANGDFSDPYLIPTDVDPEFASDGYSLKRLQRSLRAIKGRIGKDRQVILMLDACFSGDSPAGSIIGTSFAGGLKLRIPKADDRIVQLAASTARQVANWDRRRKHGLFTSQFLSAVEGKADNGRFGNQDGFVSWKEMSSYLKYKVSYLSKNGRGRREQNPVITKTSKVKWRIPAGRVTMPIERERQKPAVIDVKEAFYIARTIDEAEHWRAFLGEYPKSRYSNAARAALRKLEKRQNVIKTTAPASCKIEAYQAAASVNTSDAYQAFIDVCPTGYWAKIARISLKKIRVASYTPPEVPRRTAPPVVVRQPRVSPQKSSSGCDADPKCVVKTYYNALGSDHGLAKKLWYNLTSKRSRLINQITGSSLQSATLVSSSNYYATINADTSVSSGGAWEGWRVRVELRNTSRGWRISKIKGLGRSSSPPVGSYDPSPSTSRCGPTCVVKSYYRALGRNSRQAIKLRYSTNRRDRRIIKKSGRGGVRSSSVVYSGRRTAVINADTVVSGEYWPVRVELRNTSRGWRISKIKSRR